MKKNMILALSFLLSAGAFCTLKSQVTKANIEDLPLPVGSEWKLVWEDEFDYDDPVLDESWVSQNGPNTHIPCSRWRENAVVKDGTLKLVNKKESRGGQEWTSGSIWTKEWFKYGYYECKYRYAAAEATNNSFWFMTQGPDPTVGKRFEIDVNEGHYPNEMNTNIHNHSDVTVVNGVNKHPSSSKSFTFGKQPGYSTQLEIPVTTTKIRFSSTNEAHFHIREFRIYNVNEKGYPNVLSSTADGDVSGLVNYARNATITASGQYTESSTYAPGNAKDGNTSTSWVSQVEGEKWLEFDLKGSKTIGCIQFINGWQKGSTWNGLISNYKIQYWNGTEWIDMASSDAINDYDLSKEFHIYSLLWTKKELIFYFDRKEVRRVSNEFCHSASPIWLSLAIIPWGGAITDAIDGTFMEVDWVRVYQKPIEEIDAYYVRPKDDTESWHSQYQKNPSQVISTDDISELSNCEGSEKFYLAQGTYQCRGTVFTDSMQIYGGFNGKELSIDVKNRIRHDADENGIIENWEMMYPTVFVGDLNADYSSTTRMLSVDGVSLLDGVTLTNYTYKGGAGNITVGTIHDAMTVGFKGNKAMIRNCLFDGLKNTMQSGVAMITYGAQITDCLFQNNTTSAPNMGGAVYINGSGGVLTNCIFRNNSAAGTNSRGAAIYATVPSGNQKAEFLIQNCVAYNNKAVYAPALRMDPIGLATTAATSLGFQVSNCTFFNNHATYNADFGVIEANGLSGRVVNSIIHTSEHGIYRAINNALVDFKNCIVSKEIQELGSNSFDNQTNSDVGKYQFASHFSNTHTVVPVGHADYAALCKANFSIAEKNSLAVSVPALNELLSFVPNSTTNIVPTTDILGNPRLSGDLTIGAYQYANNTALEESDLNNRISIYPGIAKNFIQINSLAKGILTIYDIKGNKLEDRNIDNQIVLNVESFSAGIYLVRVSVGEQTHSSKFIKQ